MYQEANRQDFSLLLFLVGGIVWLFRRISLFEILKWFFLREKPAPAWLLDIYLILIWSGTAAIIAIFDTNIPNSSKWLFLLIIAQIVQTNIYHELLRPVYLARKGQQLHITYSRLRNLVIGFGNFVYVTCLFGLVYWKSRESFGDPNPFEVPADGIYFAFTTAWTVGSADIAPLTLDMHIKGIIISQIIVSLFLVSIILATGASAIRITEERLG